MISELMAGEETMLAPIESRKIAGMRDAGRRRPRAESRSQGR